MSESSIAHSDAYSLIVRFISREDAQAVAELSRQLGYEVSVEAISEHIVRLSSCTERQVALVACRDTSGGEEIVGWVQASVMHELQSPSYCLISGLVVSEAQRSLGIGKRLCAEVEAWSRKQGVSTIRVTSRISREGAHRFYLREGFQRIKTWAVFEKMLS
ncbi:GNAT family N-acetyltransferase [Edaphobacter paludis]|uniref:GNAT family N-acetyltransferase n=1 Tax=Edaphobacter paludis TaxID=3035702 RepID=A0AAU7CZ42_9BACT